MMMRHRVSPPSAASQIDARLRDQVAAVVEALLARGVERDQAARLAMAMVEACVERRVATLRLPS